MNVRNISLFGVLFTFFVIALGVWTRLVDAGLGCPDWPTCYGHIFWPVTPEEVSAAENDYGLIYELGKAIPEQVHRFGAAFLGLISIFLVLITYYQSSNQKNKKTSIFLLFFICCQGLFGYLTVSLKLLPIIVTIHLFGAFITLSIFFYLYIINSNLLSGLKVDGIKIISALALIVLLIQIFLGVWTSTNYASLVCSNDFPSCNGSYIPAMDFKQGFNLFQEVGINYEGGVLENPARIAIHYSHRVTALIVAIVFLILVSKLWFSPAAPLGTTVGIILITQIALGIMNVVYVLPLYIAILHTMVAALLLLATLTANILAWKR